MAPNGTKDGRVLETPANDSKPSLQQRTEPKGNTSPIPHAEFQNVARVKVLTKRPEFRVLIDQELNLVV
jgi:hypothetical protein